MDIRIDLSQQTGQIKPLHGVNNGPVTYGSLVDVTDYYRKAGIPLVRLHDPNWPHPREVDVHIVFPDFDKDPENPDSYNFSQTDDYIRSVVESGAKIVYRLGESIEHTDKKYFVHPPKDYQKWVQICLGIIRHYNHGWANGFHYKIEYWEIWNEPDYSIRMWSGTHEQYYQLYEAAATAIKKFDPGLKVGGPAAAGPTRDFVPEFLAYCRERNLPLDFFSWHTYTPDPAAIARNARHVRSLLDQYGYRQTESHLNEWNFFDADFREIWKKGNEYMRHETFERQKSAEGASFVANVLTALHDLPVQAANYYDGQPTALFCGLFDYYGVPQKTYYAFEAFQEMQRYPHRLFAQVQPAAEGLACLAGKNDAGEAAFLISNFGGTSRDYTLDIAGMSDDGKYRLVARIIDNQRNLEISREIAIEIDSSAVRLSIPRHSVILATLQAERP